MNAGVARTVLVTGASSGIGRASAVALVQRGYRVIGTSRNPADIADSARIPGVDYRALDLTDPAAIEAAAAWCADVDVLINNAGESQSGPLEELPMDAITRLFQVNVFAPVRLTQLVLPGMRARGHGRVVMVGSMLASFPLPYRSSYVSAKAALQGFARAARGELAPFGIGIATVEPGAINTGISQRRTNYCQDNSTYRTGFDTMLAALARNETAGISPARVADTILRAIDAPAPKPLYAVGSRAPVAFALRRLLPHTVMDAIVARAHGLRS